VDVERAALEQHGVSGATATLSRGRLQPEFLVVKIGGSLFSDKRDFQIADEDAIAGYAKLVAGLVAGTRNRVALIVGGGAHAHGTARRLDPDDPFARALITEANFSLLCLWARALRAEKVPAVPLQLAALCAVGPEHLIVHPHALSRWLDIGALPILCGDSVVALDGTLQILSSDRVPEVLLQVAPSPTRVVTLTDVPGVLTDGPGGSNVLREIDAKSPSAAYDALWESPEWDISGAMWGKLRALVDCARLGAECYIMQGDPNAGSLRFLLEPRDRWPSDIAYTRIADASGPWG
jgi:isopentenyl phosphate kinase